MASELVAAGKLKALFSSTDAMGPTQLVVLVGRSAFLRDAARSDALLIRDPGAGGCAGPRIPCLRRIISCCAAHGMTPRIVANFMEMFV
jgi:hypothetical protein